MTTAIDMRAHLEQGDRIVASPGTTSVVAVIAEQEIAQTTST